jgi:hypothetical protein
MLVGDVYAKVKCVRGMWFYRIIGRGRNWHGQCANREEAWWTVRAAVRGLLAISRLAAGNASSSPERRQP